MTYLDPTGTAPSTRSADCTRYTGQTRLETGWYVVADNITNNTRISVSGNVNLILADGCTLTADKGIQVSGSDGLVIWGQNAGTGALTIEHPDDHYAAIGGGGGEDCTDGGTVTINGGLVTAKGGFHGAGIGAGYHTADGEYGTQMFVGNGGKTTVNGGMVIATGGASAAGIGGAFVGSGGKTTIIGGKVIAKGGDQAAGIGGGYSGSGGTIDISGGEITAKGGGMAAGIGGGSGGAGGKVTISGGEVIATGGERPPDLFDSSTRSVGGAGIGGGRNAKGGTVTITGGTVFATGGGTAGGTGGESGAAGIGGGTGGAACTKVTIAGGMITAAGGTGAAGIGGGDGGAGGTVEITGGTVIAVRGKGDGQAIGHGQGATAVGDLTLYSEAGAFPSAGAQEYVTGGEGVAACRGAWAKVTPRNSLVPVAYVDEHGAAKSCVNYTVLARGGALTGWNLLADNVARDDRMMVWGDAWLILSDGKTLTATSGVNVAEGTSLTIYGQQGQTGALVATGGVYQAGIGGGGRQSAGTVIINGGAITATGGGTGVIGGAGIGGGVKGSGGEVVVRGGTVTATGHSWAAGIGGGSGTGSANTTTDGGTGGTVVITGGTVHAYGGNRAAGIGGANGSDGGSITISGGTVVAQRGGSRDAQAIGHGERGAESGALAFDGMKVYDADGAADPVSHGKRMEVCRGAWAKLAPCDSHSYTAYANNGADHLIICAWCGDEDGHEGHSYADSVCVCGATLPIPYVDPTAAGDSNKTCATWAPVTSGTTTLTNGWYGVNADVEIPGRVAVSGDVFLILRDGRTLTATSGINVAEGTSLTIYAQSAGTGALVATGGVYQAGIGGGSGQAAGTIIINGGAITATGGGTGVIGGAGIGGGVKGPGGEVIVRGGTVTATGHSWAAGIGGGSGTGSSDTTTNGGTGGTVVITGGAVHAFGGNRAAGIGGANGSDGGSVTISGGTVVAQRGGSRDAQAIGHGERGADAGNLTFDGMKAYASETAAAPVAHEKRMETCRSAWAKLAPCDSHNYTAYVDNGAGHSVLCAWCGDEHGHEDHSYAGYACVCGATLPIPYVDPTAAGDSNKTCVTWAPVTGGTATLTNGWYGVNTEVEIPGRIAVSGDVFLILCDGKTLTATSGVNVAEGASLTIYAQSGRSGKLVATGGWGAAGIGGSEGQKAGTITINGGGVEASGGYRSAGIGGGYHADGGRIAINGGTVAAYATANAACIGGGGARNENLPGGGSGEITITGGSVTVTGNGNAIGIGSGGGTDNSDNGGAVGSIRIEGGTVKATVTGYGAAIGGGAQNAAGGAIVISGGVVEASGGYGAAIGSGRRGHGVGVTVTGGEVTAIAGSGAEAIGLGREGVNGIPPVVGEGMRAYDSELAVAAGKPVSAEARVAACARRWAKLTDCDPHNYDRQHCRWCGEASPDVSTALRGSGTGDDPYLIGNLDDWNELARFTYAGNVLPEMVFMQTADIAGVTNMVGADREDGMRHPFRGMYLGGGHTLGLALSGDDSFVAPFSHIEGVTIKNLRTSGAVSGKRYSSGLVGGVGDGTNLIENCAVSATIGTDDQYAGGIIGHGGGSARTTLEGCLFDGAFEGAADTAGTIWGWRDNGSAPILVNCLDASGSAQPIARGGNDPGAAAVSNTYCAVTSKAGSWASLNGLCWCIRPGNGVTLGFGAGVKTYGVSGIEAFDNGLLHNGVFFAKEGVSVALTAEYTGTPPEGCVITLGFSAGTVTGGGPDYTLAMPAAQVLVTANLLGLIPYVDAAGVPQPPAQGRSLGQRTELDGGWYAVTSDTTAGDRIQISGDVNLILCDDCTLAAPAGIHVPAGASLTIWRQSGGSGALTADVAGNAPSSRNAAIGGDNGGSSGTITINGGVLYAAGAAHAAGIGGGYAGAGGTVVIGGGSVTALGGDFGAGIGGGDGGNGGNVTITGGTVSARGNQGAAGIGGGDYGNGGAVRIEGGAVTAIGSARSCPDIPGKHTGQAAPGIGAGRPKADGSAPRTSGTVVITGGTVFAIAGAPDTTGSHPVKAHAIGVNRDDAESNGEDYLTISDTEAVFASPTATEPVAQDGREDACRGEWAKITPAATLSPVPYVDADGTEKSISNYTVLTGGETTLATGWHVLADDISATNRLAVSGDVRLILADGKTLTASAGVNVADGDSFTVYGQAGQSGKLVATGGWGDAGIGGSKGQKSGAITINGGGVESSGGYRGAGIGGGYHADGGVTTINGGTVKATGNGIGAGIGGGGAQNENHPGGNSGTITIAGGAVTAAASGNGSGIGSGGGTGNSANDLDHNGGAVDAIRITDGMVTASAGMNGAAIGGGDQSTAGGEILIEGGMVTATATGNGAGIGGGRGGTAPAVTIRDGTVTANASRSRGAGIGGGYCSDGGTVTITGGTVVAQRGGSRDAQAIGHGERGADAGNLTFDGMKVYASDTAAAPVAHEKRMETCCGAYAKLVPCDSHSYTAYVDNGADHSVFCAWCGDGRGHEDHSYADSACLCGATLPIPYVDPTAAGNSNKTCETWTPVTSGTATLSNGWYGVNADIESPGRIAVSGDVFLILCDGKTLTATSGVNVAEGASLTIYGQSGQSGKLVATGGWGAAGIGGSEGQKAGAITINGGGVEASGGYRSAGIGGGYHADGGRIAINGGTVAAFATANAACIGGGGARNENHPGGGSGEITITGGSVTVTGNGNAIGIGSGGGTDNSDNGGAVGSIRIEGGTVKATVTGYGAAIGGGAQNAAGGEIVISGGDVEASGRIGAAIGSGRLGHGVGVTVAGGEVTAIAGSGAEAIGLGREGVDGIPPVVGETMRAYDSESALAAGKPVSAEARVAACAGRWVKLAPCASHSYTAYVDNGADHLIICAWCGDGRGHDDHSYADYVCICGATLPIPYVDPTAAGNSNKTCATWTPVTSGTATLSNGWYGVNTEVESPGRIMVSGDVFLILCDGRTLTATSGVNVAEGASLTIYAQSAGTGALVATGEVNQAGIGGGFGQAAGTIIINGGAITAVGGGNGISGAAGIGGGKMGAGGEVVIRGGTVMATGHSWGAGIGGGGGNGNALTSTNGGAGGTVAITGGAVHAYGGNRAAGIGGANGSDGGSVTISGGTVVAQRGGSRDAQAIGHGERGAESGALAFDGMKVFASETAAAPVAHERRMETCRAAYAKLAPCASHSHTIYADNDADHSILCAWCGDVSRHENHSYADYVCVCGAMLPIPYVDPTAAGDSNKTCATWTPVTSGTATLTNGWYGVNTDVESPGRIAVSGDVFLILCDGKTLTATSGVNVAEGASLTIYGQSGQTGVLKAIGVSGAGIGGSFRQAAGTITINGGVVNATGSGNSAGIGGGNSGSGGAITINGGVVNATGVSHGAGIGGGYASTGGVIRITGGVIRAVGDFGAGIGGGGTGSTTIPAGNGGQITITGGEVAASSTVGAGIGGGGNYGSSTVGAAGGAIRIAGGVVAATSSSGAGIGGGRAAAGGDVVVAGGMVTAIARNGGVAIGHGAGGAAAGDGTLDFSDEMLVFDSPDSQTPVTGDDRIPACHGDWARILPGHPVPYVDANGSEQSCVNYWVLCRSMTALTGWFVLADDFSTTNRIVVSSAAHIILTDGHTLVGHAGVTVQNGNSLSVYGQTGQSGKLVATGNPFSAGIGGERGQTGGEIILNGGIIEATGGIWAAGIGGGGYRAGGMVAIRGENTVVIATGVQAGAGIGGGFGGKGGSVRIEGGKVTAVGGTTGAGIGGGGTTGANYRAGDGGEVVITGGTVTATGTWGAGIGGGSSVNAAYGGGSGTNVTISGGTVIASASQSGAQAIGHGAGGAETGDLSYPGMKVYAVETASAPVAAADRDGTCRSAWAKLTLCDPHGYSVYRDNGGDHTRFCAWCGAEGDTEPHNYGADGLRCPCGARRYTVTVEGGSTTNSPAVAETTVTVVANKPAAGMAFVKWTSGDGVVFANAFAAETTFTMSAKNVTVKANFTPIVTPPTPPKPTPTPKPKTYTVKFSANGGTLPKGKSMAAQTFTPGKAAKLRGNAFTRKGYVFIGWSTRKNGPVAYRNAQSVKNLVAAGKSVTLYAAWAKAEYKVVFDASGGRLPKGVKMPAQTFTYGKAQKLRKNRFIRKGYVFAGWAIRDPLATVKKIAYKDGQAVANLSKDGRTVKLYAVWKKR